MLFRGIFDQIGAAATALDVMIALGTHQPMSEEAICRRLKFSSRNANRNMDGALFNHEWDNPQLEAHRTISAGEINELSGAFLRWTCPSTSIAGFLITDQIIIAGPVFPHEVVDSPGQ